MSDQAQVKTNEIRRGLADCRRRLNDAEQALVAADATAAYRALTRLRHAASDTQSVMEGGGRYVPWEQG